MLDGQRPTFWFGGYNQHVQEILDTAGPFHRFRPSVVLLLVRLEEILPEFIDAFPSRTPGDWIETLTAQARELAALAGRAATELAASVLVQNASLARPYFGIHDAQHPEGQQEAVRQFNRALAEAVSRHSGVFVWDFEAFVRTRGLDALYDPKAWYVSKNPFKQAALPSLVDDLYRYIRSVTGHVTKCVVVDLDNTLWGGIAGEDGIEGVGLGQTYPGNCFRDFQQQLLKLYHRGIVLAINSKNNEADAFAIIDRHPDMLLRREHFAAYRINWDDKAANLRSLSKELNIGFESMVFLDDNPAECDLIRREIPECRVVVLPDKPYLLPALVDSLPGIENIRLTAEDRKKGAMYRARAAQRAQEAQSANLEDFLASLELEVAIDTATPFSTPRIAQLTQKTNQMNMTTRRYSEAQIAAFAADPHYAVFSVAATDRFGDHGIIGVLIVEFADAAARIDTFLLSCRVIGRGIEHDADGGGRRAGPRPDEARRRIPAHREKRSASGFYESAGFQRSKDPCLFVDCRKIRSASVHSVDSQRAGQSGRERMSPAPPANDFLAFVGRVVVVTGASSGIGRACAIELSRHGARTVLVGRNVTALEETRAMCDGPRHDVVQLDLTDLDRIGPEMGRLTSATGRVYGLCHAAGATATHPLAATTPTVVQSLMAVTLMAGLELARTLTRRNVMEPDGGSLVFLSSVYGRAGVAGEAAYSASKGAITAAVRSLAIELARRHIRVNAISPGLVATPMTDRALQSLSPEQASVIVGKHPLGTGTPADVARAAVFLLAPGSGWITGTDLVVDGGYSAQ